MSEDCHDPAGYSAPLTPSVPPPEIFKYFDYEHLPVDLQKVAAGFRWMAKKVIVELPDSEERAMCLRKLLEAKDCAVRAALDDPW